MESPECPVCLQSYDGDATIPRVLSCGHSACESCLAKLPQRFPLTIRCPACTQLVKFPSQGPSVLPKNIDLLSFTLSLNPNPNSRTSSDESRKRSSDHSSHDFLPRFWSDEFYASWKDWILPHDVVFVETRVCGDERLGLFTVFRGKARVCFREGQKVSLVRVVSLPALNDDKIFEFSYVFNVMKCLSGMREEERSELGLILRAKSSRKICRVYGIWGNLGDGYLYVVCERIGDGSFLEKIGDLRNEFCGENGVSAFALIGLEMIEAVIGLHSEGLIAGFVSLSCFNFDCFGHAFVDVSEVLVAGRKVRKSIADAVLGRVGVRIDDQELEGAISNLLKEDVFLSPELLIELFHKEDVSLESDSSRHSIGYGSDIWSLACLLLRFLLGEMFTEEFQTIIKENKSDLLALHSIWNERVSSLLDAHLGTEYGALKDTLLKCLIYDPESRPLLNELRKCFKEMTIKPQFDLASLEGPVDEDRTTCCMILGELCQLPKEMSQALKESKLQGIEASGDTDLNEVKADSVDKNFVEVLSKPKGTIKSKDLQGHRDCITGITVGGGFLFSSSFDKTIRVWSLQDLSHVHTFEGHEHKVMAIVYVDQEQPLCISGDSGGGIFVWASTTPLGQEPLKKWYEQKDWRYSGIHALCFSKNGYVYTGSGDKSIKAWLLQDGLLACTMNGHKSVVSTLAICDEVLYSGSWDGTIRLWSLSDHTPLTVLGEDISVGAASVLSLAVDRHMLIAAYENGCTKVWRNEVFTKSMQLHEGAIFATSMYGKWVFTGGWDKTVNVQELPGEDFHLDPRPIGSIPCGSVVTVLLFWQGKLYVGSANRLIKVYYCEK